VKFVSLFSGAGGFDLGFEKSGMECVLQVEQDKYALDVLNRHWPDVPKMEDVRDVTAKVTGGVELIVGGFPCQDCSIANGRNRKGLDGERSGLWYEFRRILEEARPEWCVIENVPGLLTSNGGRDFAIVLQGLEELRYGTAWRTLDSQHFGVPQRRRRLFIVGHLGDGRAAEVLFERESLCRDTAKSRQERTPTARETEECFNPASPQVVFTYSMNWQSGQGGLNPQEEKTDALIANQTVAVYSPLSDGGVRRLTPTECCRLQGFPDNHNDWLSDAQRYKQMGNAVTVNVAQWIGRRIKETE